MLQTQPYIVLINGRHRVRVFAWDANHACQRGSTVYEFCAAAPEPIASIAAEADLKSANLMLAGNGKVIALPREAEVTQ